MAETVTEYSVTIASDGSLALSGAGLYNVTIDAGTVTPPDEITSLTGISALDMFDLRPATASDLFILRHNPSNGIYLQEDLDFETVSGRDKITLRGSASNVVEEEYRRRFPSG